MDGKATIEEVDRSDLLTAGYAPMRLAGVGSAVYYLVNCDHGMTQLHETTGADPDEVQSNLIKEHNKKLGCTCHRS